MQPLQLFLGVFMIHNLFLIKHKKTATENGATRFELLRVTSYNMTLSLVTSGTKSKGWPWQLDILEALENNAFLTGLRGAAMIKHFCTTTKVLWLRFYVRYIDKFTNSKKLSLSWCSWCVGNPTSTLLWVQKSIHIA